MSHPDELMSRDRLLDAVWGWDYPTGKRTVDTRIAELRRVLNDDPLTHAILKPYLDKGIALSLTLHHEMA